MTSPLIPRFKLILTVVLTSVSSLSEAKENPDPPEVDPVSGMKIDEHWETVRAMCSSCHSPRLFTSYGGSRATWKALIRWMQKKQGLWELPPEIETQILAYLAKNYPPGKSSRRRNLPAHLRPPNPYVSEARAEYEEKLKNGEIKQPVMKNE